MKPTDPTFNGPHVVIIGGGFGGLTATKALRRERVGISLLDRTNHHLFQPLLYQVATAGLSAADIASPIRSILAKQENALVLMGEVTRVDLERSAVIFEGEPLVYDYLIVAAGAHTHYFGHDDWESIAPGLKSIDDAIDIRRKVLLAFEQAEHEENAERRRALLTFVVIGGGPTGAEMAGALAELGHFVLARDFRRIDPTSIRVVLLEAGPRVLPAFDSSLSDKGLSQLADLGVEVRLGQRVTRLDDKGAHVGNEFIPAATIVWAAGVRASPLAATLGVPLDREGRIVVEHDLSIPDYPKVFAIGDVAAFVGEDGHTLPGLSPVAMQEAEAVAASIRGDLAGKPRKSFRYFDKGIMATLGRSRGVVQIGHKVRLSGWIAWMAWLFVHVLFLIGFRNRIIVMFNWVWSYVTYKRGARLITGMRAEAP